MNRKVDKYLSEESRWKQEMKKLIKILLAGSLTKEFNWGKPCYTFQ